MLWTERTQNGSRRAKMDPRWDKNIAIGTTDLRVEFSLPKYSSLGHITRSYTNLVLISSSESQPSINFKISTKHQHFDFELELPNLDQT